jgi:ATP-dependent helicase HepA
VRWLLADEVGLGKTVEACLILSRLLRTGRADRALVVAPSTLTIQWLGELYRKFHQTFVLLDKKRREDVAKDHGESYNPFEAHRHMVVGLEDLEGDSRLAAQAAAAVPDLVVVDEAHRLERGRGDPGNDAYRAVAPLAAAARHVLLLSATPLEADAHGFFRLLELVRPDAYPSEEGFLAALGAGRPLPPCTSATRRVDIGGLPARVPQPVDLPRSPASDTLAGDLTDRDDPRVQWLVAKASAWARGGAEEGKTLVFCHERQTLAALRDVVEAKTRRRVAVFHEELTPERRDLEVAEFRRPDGPAFLVATECGGEGRNFEFCRRLVLFDLPDDPASVEQRIGRLDRISRRAPVEIVYFRPPSGFGADLVRLYEAIGLFVEPLGGLERSLAHVEAAIGKARRMERVGRAGLDVEALALDVRNAATARASGIYHHLHSGGYRVSMADAIRSRVPSHLDGAMERFVLEACDVFGFETADRPGKKCWYVEFGGGAILEHLPGVPGGSRYLGTFSRDEAVEREDLDFFASGHPLVEGIFQELEDGSRGRSGIVMLAKAGEDGEGILFIHHADGEPRATFLDLAGNERPDLADRILRHRGSLRGIKPGDWFESLRGRAAEPRYWPKLVRSLAARLPIGAQVVQAGAVRLVR